MIDLIKRAVLSLVYHGNTKKHEFRGAGWEMARLGLAPEVAYELLDKQDGLMYGTGLMTCWFDGDDDPSLKQLTGMGGPLSLEEARDVIRKLAAN